MGLLDHRRAKLIREIEAWQAKIAAWDPANYADPKRAKQALATMKHSLRRRQKMLKALEERGSVGFWMDMTLD